MKKIFLIIALILGISQPARAASLGCFNGSDTVHVIAQFADASGVAASPTSPSAKVFSPTDTTSASFTPTLAEIDSSGSPGLARGSFSLGASPAAGTWTVQYKGTVGGSVLVAADTFQVPCPKMAVKFGGIPAGASAADGTLSTISTTTLTLSTDMIAATNHHAFQVRIEVLDPTTYTLKAESCVVASTTAAGPADTVTTAEDISARIATSDAFYLIPDPACRNLRGTTAGNTFDVASTGEGGLDFNNVLGTLDAAEIGTGAITNAKFAAGAIDATAIASNAITSAKIATDAIGAAQIAANAIGSSEIASGAITNAKFATGAIDATAIADGAVADEVWGALRASYTASGTFGQSHQVIRAGTAQAGASTTITLDASASATNDFYANARIDLISGTGAPQTRLISSYVGSSKVATVNSAWAVSPASDTVFVISGSGVNSAVTGLTAADVWTYSTRSLTDKTGFSLTQAFPTNFASLAITAGGAVTAGTVSDKTGYSLSQSFPTNFANLSIDANGRVDLSKWLGSAPNALIAGRVDSNAQVVGDKTGYSLTQSFPANFSSLSIDGSGRIDISKVRGVTLNTQVGTNLDVFFQNAGNVTAKVVDDVGGAGSGAADWTATEKNQLRYRLGIDGTTAIPSATPTLGAVTGSLSGAVGSVAGNVAGNVAGSVGSIGPGGITSASFANDSITAAAIATDAIGAAEIAAGAIGSSELANGAITSAKFGAGAVDATATGLPTASVVAASGGCNSGTNSTTVFATSLTQTVTNFWKSTQLITMTSGTLAGQTAQIGGYVWTGSVGCLTLTSPGLTSAPGVGDAFMIINK